MFCPSSMNWLKIKLERYLFLMSCFSQENDLHKHVSCWPKTVLWVDQRNDRKNNKRWIKRELFFKCLIGNIYLPSYLSKSPHHVKRKTASHPNLVDLQCLCFSVNICHLLISYTWTKTRQWVDLFKIQNSVFSNQIG